MKLADLDRFQGYPQDPMPRMEAVELAREIPLWALKETSLERVFRFTGFRQAMEFVNKVAEIADKQDHHPDIFISYNKVLLTLSTHKIGGLSAKDFLLAAAIDPLAAA
jgi:4a-hydroxytetrahydrobiopterin dehydratase